jgi:hypothetical protein
MKDELQNIISGKSKVKYDRAIQAVTRYLKRSYSAGELVKDEKQFKSKETALLKG